MPRNIRNLALFLGLPSRGLFLGKWAWSDTPTEGLAGVVRLAGRLRERERTGFGKGGLLGLADCPLDPAQNGRGHGGLFLLL